MPCRIGDYVLAGEIRNTRRNGVFGWIEFAPDWGIRLELTGNLNGQLEGKHLRFRLPREESDKLNDPDSLPESINNLADRQIGAVGEMTLRRVTEPTIAVEEFLKLSAADQQSHMVEKDCLYLEWYSQNGRVIAEIVDPQIEFVQGDESSKDSAIEFEQIEPNSYGLGFTEIHSFDDPQDADQELLDDDDEEEDPYGLFAEDLDNRVSEALDGITDESFNCETLEGDGGKNEKRSWDEVIPGIDSDTKAMYEQWDEIFEGKKDEPLSYLMQTPLKLPKPENVESEEEAAALVTAILAQLALLSVALDVCEHFSAVDTYRLLMNEILPIAKVHPNLAASEMVQHYSTSDYCPQCEAEFDAEYDGNEDNEDQSDAS